MNKIDTDLATRAEVLRIVWDRLETFYSDTKSLKVGPELDKSQIQKWITDLIQHPSSDMTERAISVVEGLKRYSVHTSHPAYFGLFNPRSSFAGIVADLITATMNPQLAAWSHAPLANEIEQYLIHDLGEKFGYTREASDGVFCSGGAEANLSAVLCAVTDKVSDYKRLGLINQVQRPIIYCSEHAHHSVARAARIVGLGSDSVALITTDSHQRMNTSDLILRLRQDRSLGHLPIMVIATAGTTGPGSIDPLIEVGKIARQEGLWYHIDGAYGAAVILSEAYADLLHGIAWADSITFDIHKWLAVPMGASVLLTRHKSILQVTFGMSAAYMPGDSKGMSVTDPYMHSIQWSRRFIGLKLFMSILAYGWSGLGHLVDHHIDLGHLFRTCIQQQGWVILNDTPLPVVCFTDAEHIGIRGYAEKLCKYMISTGRAWLSVYPIDDCDVLRVCFNNYITEAAHVHDLVTLLGEARSHVGV